jgi:dTDP-4-dehydrorhamnose reductase
VNAEAPGVLAEEAGRVGAVFVHYSTDYVFDGAESTPYEETHEAHPLGVYGASKLAGERAVESAAGRSLVFRTSWLYSPHGRSFFDTMVRLAESSAGREAPVGDTVWGTYHLTAKGETTWHGFAEAIFAGVAARGGRVPRLEAIPSSEYPTPAARPAYSVLDTRKFAWTFGVVPTPWQEQLEQVLDDRLGRTRSGGAAGEPSLARRA